MKEVKVRTYLEKRGHIVDWRPGNYGHGDIFVDNKWIDRHRFRFDSVRNRHYAAPEVIRNTCWKAGIQIPPEPRKEPGKAFFVSVIVIGLIVLMILLLAKYWGC